MLFKRKKSKYYKTHFQLFLWNLLNKEHAGYITFSNFFNESRQKSDNKFQTFPDFLDKLIDKLDGEDRGTKERQFLRKTRLSSKFLTDCKSNPDHKPTRRTVIAIIMGLDLDSTDKDNVLRLSGNNLVGNDTLTQAYIFLLAQRGKKDFEELVKEYKGCVITASNHILSEIYEAKLNEYKKSRKRKGISSAFVLGKYER